jgi:hypothetical protein
MSCLQDLHAWHESGLPGGPGRCEERGEASLSCSQGGSQSTRDAVQRPVDADLSQEEGAAQSLLVQVAYRPCTSQHQGQVQHLTALGSRCGNQVQEEASSTTLQTGLPQGAQEPPAALADDGIGQTRNDDLRARGVRLGELSLDNDAVCSSGGK